MLYERIADDSWYGGTVLEEIYLRENESKDYVYYSIFYIIDNLGLGMMCTYLLHPLYPVSSNDGILKIKEYNIIECCKLTKALKDVKTTVPVLMEETR